MVGAPLVGTVLAGRYRLERVIGAGGMGAVYEATQLDLGRKVAVKVLHDVDPRAITRLRQEASTAGTLSCPYVVSIFDFQAQPNEPAFIVMELLVGESLAHRLARTGPLPVPEACRVAMEALIGLDAAHRSGIIHRDIKPSNLWLASGRGMEGHVKVVDFGIAKGVDVGAGQTTTGSLVGTPAYLSPEQLRGLSATDRSDQHAMGVVLYEMITGARPWRAHGMALLAEILEHVPPSLTLMAPHIPPALAAVVARALAKDPAGRFASADDMRQALAPFVMGLGSERSPSLQPPHASAPPTIGPSTPSTVGAMALPSFGPPPMEPPAPPLTPSQDSGSSRARIFVVAMSAVLLPALGIGGLFAARHMAGANAPDTSPAPADAGDHAAVNARPLVPSATASTSAAPVETAKHATPDTRPDAQRADAGAVDPRMKPKCECLDRRGRLICLRPMTPRCACDTPEGLTMCPVKWRESRCPTTTFVVGHSSVGTNYSGPGLKSGASCDGFYRTEERNDIPAKGKLDCSTCYGSAYEAAVPNTPCSGIHEGMDATGGTATGVWVCD